MDPNVPQPPVGTIVPPVIPPVQNIPPGNNKKVSIIIGAIVFLLLVIGFITFFVIQGSRTPIVTVTPTEASPTPTPNPKILLRKNIKTAVSNTDISLTFLGKVDQEAGCTDCYTSTEVLMQQKAKQVKLSYLCGGFAGVCSTKEEGFGYTVELTRNIDPTIIEVIVTKK